MEEVWNIINVENSTVLDVGVGESTRILVEKNRNSVVTCIDESFEKLKSFLCRGSSNVMLVCADAAHLPFRSKVFDTAVLSFMLHEVDPCIHRRIIEEVRKVSAEIVIVEPSPRGCEAYNVYAGLWRKAMHSIGRFEDYKPLTYWVGLLEDCSLQVIYAEELKQNIPLTMEEVEHIVRESVEAWKRLGVPENIVEEMREFINLAKSKGFKWSNLAVVIGVSGDRRHDNVFKRLRFKAKY